MTIWLCVTLVSNTSTVTSEYYRLKVASVNKRLFRFLGDSTKEVHGNQDIVAVDVWNAFNEILFPMHVSRMTRKLSVQFAKRHNKNRKTHLKGFDLHVFFFHMTGRLALYSHHYRMTYIQRNFGDGFEPLVESRVKMTFSDPASSA